jgi:hypothetical protein
VRLLLACQTVDSAVLQKNVTASEMDAIHFSCSTIHNKSVWWNVRTVLHEERDQGVIYNYESSLKILNSLTDGRFRVTYKSDVYNLTIINATVTDAGDYRCIEREGLGETSSTSLNIKG